MNNHDKEIAQKIFLLERNCNLQCTTPARKEIPVSLKKTTFDQVILHPLIQKYTQIQFG